MTTRNGALYTVLAIWVPSSEPTPQNYPLTSTHMPQALSTHTWMRHTDKLINANRNTW